ncbi:MAG: helix-turn-helix domain-containing protein [Acidaminococcaceae bacterium]|nr:helix-turn-helix domain-containing protein [Acidaminococcaceae bacterium]
MEKKPMEKKFYTVRDLYCELGGVVTRSQLYRMIEQGEIPTRKIGKKIVIPADWVVSYINMPAVAVVKKPRETAC